MTTIQSMFLVSIIAFIVLTIVAESIEAGLLGGAVIIVIFGCYNIFTLLAETDVDRYDKAKKTCDARQGVVSKIDTHNYECKLPTGLVLKL